MNNEEQQYLNLLQQVLDTGEDRTDRTGIGTKSIFGSTLRFSLRDDTIPLLTTKKIYFKGVVEELLFFLRGETQTKKLEAVGVNIWKGNTSRDFLDKRGLNYLPEGSYGKSYGYQWRRFGSNRQIEGSTQRYSVEDIFEGADQISDVLTSLKNDPMSRRHLVSAWNPDQLDQSSLPPCHTHFQFYVSGNKELSCQFYMRSSDVFVGAGFNFASYALLTHIFAATLGYTAKELIYCAGDVHLYNNVLDQTRIQLAREPKPFPKIKINKSLSCIKDIESLQFSDFELIGYDPAPAIKVEMAI